MQRKCKTIEGKNSLQILPVALLCWLRNFTCSLTFRAYSTDVSLFCISLPKNSIKIKKENRYEIVLLVCSNGVICCDILCR